MLNRENGRRKTSGIVYFVAGAATALIIATLGYFIPHSSMMTREMERTGSALERMNEICIPLMFPEYAGHAEDCREYTVPNSDSSEMAEH